VFIRGSTIAADPELYDLLLTEVPHRTDGTQDFAVRPHGAFLLAISSRARELKKGRNLEKLVFVVTHMVESLSHGALFPAPRRPVARSGKERNCAGSHGLSARIGSNAVRSYTFINVRKACS